MPNVCPHGMIAGCSVRETLRATPGVRRTVEMWEKIEDGRELFVAEIQAGDEVLSSGPMESAEAAWLDIASKLREGA